MTVGQPGTGGGGEPVARGGSTDGRWPSAPIVRTFAADGSGDGKLRISVGAFALQIGQALRVAATNVVANIFGQRLSGDFTFERITTAAPALLSVVRISLENVALALGTESTDYVTLSNGSGALIIQTGGVSGTLGLAEDPSRFSIACRQVGPITLPEKLRENEEVFTADTSILFKETRVVRMFDRKRNTLVYLSYSTKMIEGSPMNAVSTVPIMPWRQ